MLIETSTNNSPHVLKRLDEVDTHETINLYPMCRTTITFDNVNYVILFNSNLLAAFLTFNCNRKSCISVNTNEQY